MRVVAPKREEPPIEVAAAAPVEPQRNYGKLVVARAARPGLKIEIEVDTLDQLREALTKPLISF